MALKAVLFDMDGVIVDTERLNRKAYFGMFEFFNLPVDQNLYKTFIGRSTDSVCQELIDKFSPTATKAELLAKKREIFTDLFNNDPEFDLILGVRSLIENYYNNNITLVLASSARLETIQLIFDRFSLNKYFRAKISGTDLKESKPNPEIFIKAAQLSGELPENCIVIEDSTNGINAAHKAGIFCVAYRSEHSHNQDYTNANLVIDDYTEVEFEKASKWFKRL